MVCYSRGEVGIIGTINRRTSPCRRCYFDVRLKQVTRIFPAKEWVRQNAGSFKISLVAYLCPGRINCALDWLERPR